MQCVLVWRDRPGETVVVRSSALGIFAQTRGGRRARALPDPLVLARAELQIARAVVQASHVVRVVRLAEGVMLADAGAKMAGISERESIVAHD